MASLLSLAFAFRWRPGDGTGFGQSSDKVMLMAPERLNAALNGSDPLRCFAIRVGINENCCVRADFVSPNSTL